MDFFPSSALEEARRLSDAAAAEHLAAQLNWDYPDIDNFREIVYRCPALAELIQAKARTLEHLSYQRTEWEQVACEGEQFQRLCTASSEERDAAAVMVSLLPQNSKEKTRQAILLVLAELRHRPAHAATLACNLWTGDEARYWLKELIYALWYAAPERIAPTLEALWAVWQPHGCHYYRSEAHDIILARIQAAVENQEVDKYIQPILFLTKKRGSCHNDRETVEYLLTNLHRFPKKYEQAIASIAISYAQDSHIQKQLLRSLSRFSEHQQQVVLKAIIKSIVHAMNTGYQAALPETRGLSALKKTLSPAAARTLQELRRIYFFSRVYFLVWDYGDLDISYYQRHARWMHQPWPAPLERQRRKVIKRILTRYGNPPP